jgi:hypothetical protein
VFHGNHRSLRYIWDFDPDSRSVQVVSLGVV